MHRPPTSVTSSGVLSAAQGAEAGVSTIDPKQHGETAPLTTITFLSSETSIVTQTMTILIISKDSPVMTSTFITTFPSRIIVTGTTVLPAEPTGL